MLPEFAVRGPAGYVRALGIPLGRHPEVSRRKCGRRTLIDGGPASLMGWPRWNDLKNRRFCSDVAVSAR